MRAPFATAARIAGRQHGRITRRQLLGAGVDRNRIARWVADGRLRRVHVGVYAVGHAAPSSDGDYIAAVLAGGEGAVLSHRAAAHKLDLLRGMPPRPEITVPTTAHRRRPGIVIHRVRSLHPLDVSTEQNIPITIVPRILLDLSPAMSPAQLARACHEAWVRHECGPDKIEACIARNPRKPGAGKLRHALGTDVTLSFLEDAFLELLAAHDLPAPRTNVDHNEDKVDCHWAHLDLTIELLSYRYHASRHAFEDDVARIRRSNSLAYTYADVVERGAATAAELRPLLTPRGYPTSAAELRPLLTPRASPTSARPHAGHAHS